MKKLKYAFIGFAAIALTGCADLNYHEGSSRDEEWTYNSPINGVKNLVFDVYAQLQALEVANLRTTSTAMVLCWQVLPTKPNLHYRIRKFIIISTVVGHLQRLFPTLGTWHIAPLRK